jgi:DnaK suppressor protein
MAASAGKKTGTRVGAKKAASKTTTAKSKVAKTSAAKTKVPSKAKTASTKAAKNARTQSTQTPEKPSAKTAKAKATSKQTKKPVTKPAAKVKAGAPKANAVAAKKTSVGKKPTSKPSAKKKTTAKSRVPAPSRPSTRSVDSPFRSFTPHEPKKDEGYMSEIQVAHFRNILLQWRQDLMEEVDRTVHHMRDEAANFPDPADRATQEEEFSIELRTRDRERKLIKKIDQTLERVDQRDFGYCDTCGVEIGLRRLEARPTATQCVDCKSLDEIKERQLHG